MTACRNHVGYPEVEFSGVLHICKHSLITECQVVRAKQSYNDYSKEQFIIRIYNMSHNEHLVHIVQHLIQIQDAEIAGQKDFEVYEIYEETNKDTNIHTNTISAVSADIVHTDSAEPARVSHS